MTNDQRQYAPATERNRDPILAVLKRVLPPTGTVLEVASGTGQHAAYFAPRLQPLQWLPSDPNPMLRESIAAWREEAQAENLLAPIVLDASTQLWPVETEGKFNSLEITAVVNINMIHISPWSAGLGLLAGANRILPPGGVLYLYGPYQRHNQHTAPSNAQFDASLQAQNPEWGVRHLEAVVSAAQAEGLELQEVVEMPANNFSVIFKKVA
jgi:SAM-dependent methyltransferase